MAAKLNSVTVSLVLLVGFIAYQAGYARGHQVMPSDAPPVPVDLDAVLQEPGPEARFCDDVLDMAKDHLEWRHAMDQKIQAEGMPHE